MFLSDRWADYVKQPVPKRWEGLTLEEKQRRVKRYARRVTRHFQSEGIDIELYEIGNEIDFGISGEYEDRWSHRFNLDWMKLEIWPRAAGVIRSAQQGVLDSDTSARFMLHVAQWWNPEFTAEFYRTMQEHDVRVDYLGLSYFPTSGLGEKNSLEYFGESVSKLTESVDRPVVIPEFAYPVTDSISGQFADWNQPVPGYELSSRGQKRWTRDFIRYAGDHPDIKQVYYWSPEWYVSSLWEAFSLFDPEGNSRPGLSVLTDPPISDRKDSRRRVTYGTQ